MHNVYLQENGENKEANGNEQVTDAVSKNKRIKKPKLSEWVLVAMVLDRVCFIIGLVATLIPTIIFFV